MTSAPSLKEMDMINPNAARAWRHRAISIALVLGRPVHGHVARARASAYTDRTPEMPVKRATRKSEPPGIFGQRRKRSKMFRAALGPSVSTNNQQMAHTGS
jgi:hypothetical protein